MSAKAFLGLTDRYVLQSALNAEEAGVLHDVVVVGEFEGDEVWYVASPIERVSQIASFLENVAVWLRSRPQIDENGDIVP